MLFYVADDPVTVCRSSDVQLSLCMRRCDSEGFYPRPSPPMGLVCLIAEGFSALASLGDRRGEATEAISSRSSRLAIFRALVHETVKEAIPSPLMSIEQPKEKIQSNRSTATPTGNRTCRAPALSTLFTVQISRPLSLIPSRFRLRFFRFRRRLISIRAFPFHPPSPVFPSSPITVIMPAALTRLAMLMPLLLRLALATNSCAAVIAAGVAI